MSDSISGSDTRKTGKRVLFVGCVSERTTFWCVRKRTLPKTFSHQTPMPEPDTRESLPW
jgi:hypothetical protein